MYPVKNMYPVNSDKKIFVIGFNKTATTTFHKLFLNNNLKSQHADKKNEYWDTDKYDCFSDKGNWHNFKKLNTAYPNSTFILNVRRLDEWIMSRFKHGELHKQSWAYPATTALCTSWIKQREYYHMDVLDYFKNNPNKLIIVNIDKPDWISYICEKLNFKNNSDIRANVITTTPDHATLSDIINVAFNKLHYNECDKSNLLFKDAELSKYYLDLYTNNIL